jgi:hypothetical protein
MILRILIALIFPSICLANKNLEEKFKNYLPDRCVRTLGGQDFYEGCHSAFTKQFMACVVGKKDSCDKPEVLAYACRDMNRDNLYKCTAKQKRITCESMIKCSNPGYPPSPEQGSPARKRKTSAIGD